MTTVTHAVSSTTPRRGDSLLGRLAALVAHMRSTAAEGLEVTIARAVDEAFASLAREFRH